MHICKPNKEQIGSKSLFVLFCFAGAIFSFVPRRMMRRRAKIIIPLFIGASFSL